MGFDMEHIRGLLNSVNRDGNPWKGVPGYFVFPDWTPTNLDKYAKFALDSPCELMPMFHGTKEAAVNQIMNNCAFKYGTNNGRDVCRHRGPVGAVYGQYPDHSKTSFWQTLTEYGCSSDTYRNVIGAANRYEIHRQTTQKSDLCWTRTPRKSERDRGECRDIIPLLTYEIKGTKGSLRKRKFVWDSL